MPTRRAIVAALTSGAIAGNRLLPRTKQVCILLKVAAGILLAMLAAANILTTHVMRQRVMATSDLELYVLTVSMVNHEICQRVIVAI